MENRWFWQTPGARRWPCLRFRAKGQFSLTVHTSDRQIDHDLDQMYPDLNQIYRDLVQTDHDLGQTDYDLDHVGPVSAVVLEIPGQRSFCSFNLTRQTDHLDRMSAVVRDNGLFNNCKHDSRQIT